MKTSKSYILKGGDKWGQVGTKSPLCPSLSLLKRKGGTSGDKVGTKWGLVPLRWWGQGGDKILYIPPL